jgi:Isoprenylcysteine carboxyl methyltransferase (ICMT) family
VRTERLVADGPYRHVRNPLYLGTVLIGCAMAPLTSRTGSVVLVVSLILFSLRLIGREEAELRAAQGESYEGFLNTVPKLLPSLRARVPASGAKPQLGQALLGEGFIMAFALGVILFAFTLNQKLMWSGVALGFIFAGLGRFTIKKAAEEKSAGA